jgi:hypothetical protein
MRKMELGLIVICSIAGVYFVLFHKAPLPLNHESVGLGTLHFVHDIIGVVLLGIAGLIWWRSRRSRQTVAPA